MENVVGPSMGRLWIIRIASAIRNTLTFSEIQLPLCLSAAHRKGCRSAFRLWDAPGKKRVSWRLRGMWNVLEGGASHPSLRSCNEEPVVVGGWSLCQRIAPGAR